LNIAKKFKQLSGGFVSPLNHSLEMGGVRKIGS